MNRSTTMDVAGDLVDSLNIRLARVETLQRAIQIGCEEGLTHEEVFTLSNIAGDETHKARVELEKWWDGLAMEK